MRCVSVIVTEAGNATMSFIPWQLVRDFRTIDESNRLLPLDSQWTSGGFVGHRFGRNRANLIDP